MSLSSGTQLGPYEILGLIGSGGMGNVYRAHDPKLGRDVAIKVLPPGFAMDERRLKRFQREARILASLSHPNLVQVFDAGEQDGHPYLVMELLSGETLRNRLARGRLPWRKAAELVAAVADGLAAAHARGIVHRDLKPENLFLTQTGHVKILDFGIATPQRYDLGDSTTVHAGESTRTQEGLLLGTVGYMSPEQIRGEPLDGRSDLFSLGVILWEALNGQRPFRGPTSVEVLSAILKEEPPPMDPAAHVHPALERVLDACLAKDPQGRFHSAHDLAFALQSLSQWTGTSSERFPAKVGSRRFRWWRWAGYAAGAAAAALVFLGGYWSRLRETPLHYRQLTFQRGEIGSARFSADGLEVVYDLIQGGPEPRIYSLRLENLEDSAVGDAPARLLGLSRKGEWAVLLEPRRDQDLIESFRGILALSVTRSTAPREVLQDVVSADLSPSGDLAVVHLVQGHFKLECPMGQTRVDRGTYVSNPRFSQDGRFLAFEECAEQDLNQAETSINVLDLKTGSIRAMAGKANFLGLTWLKGEVVASSKTGRGSSEIRAFSMGGGARTITEVPGIWRVQDADSKGRLLLDEERPEISVRVWRPGLPEKNLSVRGNGSLCGLSPDGRRVLIQVFQSAVPGSQDSTIFSRPVEGGLPTYLGHGSVAALSPDGAWLAVVGAGAKASIELRPTGTHGQLRRLDLPGLEGLVEVEWTADGKALLAAGNAPGRPPRIWMLDLQSGAPRPVSPEGVISHADWMRPSPDGRYLVTEENHAVVLADLEAPGRAPAPIPGLEKGEYTAGWTRDSRKVYVWRQGPLPQPIQALDIRTGRREPFLTLAIAEEPGQILTNTFVSPEGKVATANLVRLPSNLFLLEGVK